MAARADSIFSTGGALVGGGGCTKYPVKATNGAWYLLTSNNISYRRSDDGGLSWGRHITVASGTYVAAAVWYDRWSGIAGDKIHIVSVDLASDDVVYRSIDTASSDALGTAAVVFAGVSTAGGGSLSLVRARGGDLICIYDIDGGTEHGAAKSVDGGATWTPIASPTEAVANDKWILLPGWGADNQDVIAIFHDASANELSRKVYDSSADSWTETSISTGITLPNASGSYPHFAASVDTVNSQNVVISWNAVDGANADLKCWTVTEAAITAKTDVVANGTDDQGLAALGIDTATGYWWAAYCGKSDGSETWLTATNIYCKVSQDAGATWGAETKRSVVTAETLCLWAPPRFSGDFAIESSQNEPGAVDYACLNVGAARPGVSSSWIG